MTSKEYEMSTEYEREAYFNLGKSFCENIVDKSIMGVKKDLEVLDIIKKHKLLNYVVKNDKCAKMYCLSETEKMKLKEWVEK